MSDLISRQAAIDALGDMVMNWTDSEYELGQLNQWKADRKAIIDLPPAQPKRPIWVQDILQYLDEYLHPIVSPEHWSVYSELYDMVSMLPSAQPQLDTCPIYGGMCGYPSNLCYECPRHGGAKERPQWWTEGLQPFAQPQRIKGRWTKAYDGYDGHVKCVQCFKTYDWDTQAQYYNFCPNCGADMRGEQNGKNS